MGDMDDGFDRCEWRRKPSWTLCTLSMGHLGECNSVPDSQEAKMAVDTGELQVDGDEQDIRASRDLQYKTSELYEKYKDLDTAPAKVGYHVTHIEKGELGEYSKIREELFELEDAILQEAKVMQLVELSDMIGAIEAFLERHHPGTTIDDLIKMKDITKRAFKNGHR